MRLAVFLSNFTKIVFMRISVTKYLVVFYMFCAFGSFVVEAQDAENLLSNFYKESNDTAKIDILFKVTNYYHDVTKNYDLAEKYLIEAQEIVDKTNKTGLKASVYNKIGLYYRRNSKFGEALKFHRAALEFAKQVSDSSIISTIYNNIGVVYRRVANYPLAAQNHIDALRTAEQCGDMYNVSVACNSLGNVFSLNGRYDEAIVYFNKALDYSIKSNNKLGMAMNYNNMGEVSEFKGDYQTARELYAKSLAINREIGSEQGIAICYNCLGKIALYQGNANLAYNYFKAALDLDRHINNKLYLNDSYVNLSKATIKLNMLSDAKIYIEKSLELAAQINSLIHFQWAYSNYCDYYKALGRYDQAFKYLQLSTTYKDSILNEKSNHAIASMQTLYETEKRESEIIILKQEQEIKDQRLAKQRTQNYLLLGGMFVLTVVVVGIYIMLHNKRKHNVILSQQIDEIERQNTKLAEQKEEITSQKEDIIKQKEEIEIKNENIEKAYKTIESYVYNITESIRYAEKIQESIQPTIDFIKLFFSDTVIFNKPKDIVSGDFYWMHQTPEKIYFALSDCTGHGVPGAFMSIIGIDLLNQAVRQNKNIQSDQMLSFLNLQLIKRLRQSDNDLILMDSMDIAVCVFDRKTKELSFSGALIPILIVRNGEITEIKPNVYSLGSIFRKVPIEFKTETIQLQPGDWIYISSDGYYDQIGGEQRRKYQRVKFKQFAQHISNFAGDQQQKMLQEDFRQWKENNPQIDDVLVWGLKV